MTSDEKKKFKAYAREIVEGLGDGDFKDSPEYSSPFVPGIGDQYGDNPGKRVMICGKATYGWERDGKNSWDASELLDWSKDGVCHGYKSTFWSFARQVSQAVNGGDSQDALRKIVWSNIAKLGARQGNLSGKDFKKCKNLFAELFLKELQILKPDYLVLVTGWYGHKAYIPAITSYLSGKSLKDYADEDYETYFETGDKSGLKIRVKNDMMNVWVTRHPQGWAMEQRNAVVDDIAEVAGT